jgi:hypothetical protein
MPTTQDPTREAKEGKAKKEEPRKIKEIKKQNHI